MNYGIGDKVVCIDALPKTDDPEDILVAGVTYVVHSVNSRCCSVEGIVCHDEFDPCSVCGDDSGDPNCHYDNWRFIKLDGLQQGAETCTELERSAVE